MEDRSPLPPTTVSSASFTAVRRCLDQPPAYSPENLIRTVYYNNKQELERPKYK